MSGDVDSIVARLAERYIAAREALAAATEWRDREDERILMQGLASRAERMGCTPQFEKLIESATGSE